MYQILTGMNKCKKNTPKQQSKTHWWLWNKSHLHTHTHTRAGPPVVLGMRCAETAMRMLRAQRADLEVDAQNVVKWFGNVRMRRRGRGTREVRRHKRDRKLKLTGRLDTEETLKVFMFRGRITCWCFGLVWLKSFPISLRPFIALCVCVRACAFE